MNADVVEITIAGDPVAQGRGRIVKRGPHFGIADPPKSKEWKQDLKLLAQQHAQSPLWDCPVGMDLTVVCQRPKSAKKAGTYKATKPDLSNYEKGIEDALEGVIYCNDARICVKTSRKVFGVAPGIMVRLWKIGEGT